MAVHAGGSKKGQLGGRRKGLSGSSKDRGTKAM